MKIFRCLRCGKLPKECECNSFESKKVTKPIKGIEKKIELPPLPNVNE